MGDTQYYNRLGNTLSRETIFRDIWVSFFSDFIALSIGPPVVFERGRDRKTANYYLAGDMLMSDAPIVELVVSLRWRVSVGHIDDSPHVILRLQHPRIGPLDFLLPNNDAIELAAALEKSWERRDDARIGRSAARDPDSIATIHPQRPDRAPMALSDDEDASG